MKQKLLLKTLLLLLCMIVGLGNAWADKKTEGFESATTTTTYNSTQTITTEKSDCGIAWSIYYGSPSATGAITGGKSCLIRYYTADAKLGYAQTTTGIKGLTNVTFNAKVTNTGNKMGVWYSTDGEIWTALATDVTLTTSSSSKSYDIPNSSSATTYYIKIGLTTGSSTNKKDLIIDDVAFTYVTSVVGTTDAPTISGDTPFLGSTTVTIANAASADGADIYYTLNGDEPTTTTSATCFEYSAPFSIDATTTVKAIAKKSTDTNASSVVSKTFTKITPLANIAALTANTETNTYYVTLTDAVVTYVSGSYAYIQDASGAVALYKSDHGFTAGDVLNGTATISYQLRNNNPQITDISGVTPVSGSAPAPTAVAQSAWAYTFSDVLSQYFKITGATITKSGSKYYVSLGGEDIQLYKNGGSISSLNLGEKYNITGFPMLYNTTMEIQIFEDPEVVTSPALSVTPATATAFSYAVGNGPSDYQMFTITGKNLVSADITATVSNDYEITDNTEYSSSVTIASGAIVSVRLKAGLAKGEHNGTLTLSSTDATNVVINLSGTVTGQTYAIEQYTSPATAHGTITFSPASPVEDGTEVTLSAEPTEGYTFTADSWVIYKQSGEDYVVDNSVAVTDNKITMPAYAIYVDATFAPIAVTGVTLNKTKATIGIDDTETLTATIAPANAQNKAVAWESSNTDVATVANGVVTGVAEGTATITATTEDGSFTATCDVTVMNAVIFDCSSDTETSKNGVSFGCSDISSTDGFKFYKSSSTTFSVANGVIKKIEFTCTASGTTKYGPGCFGEGAPSGYTYSGTIGTWEGSATSVNFAATDNQVRATKIKVFVTTTAIPTFSVAEGEYDEAKNVELSCATEGATIYYTTDGTIPTSSSTEYTGGISITETTTLKAIAIKDEVASAVASATFTMIRPAAPAFDPAAFVFDAAFDVHLSTETDGATIYYTTDDSTPTSSSTAYDDKNGISISTGSDVTVKAIAFKNGLTSDVATVTYTYDARITPSFSLSSTELNLKVNDASDAVTLTTNSDGEVAFTCEDAHVTLSGTGNSRTILADAAGEYTVNVSVANSATYKDAAGTITVTVTKKATTMAISNVFDDGLDLRYAHGGEIEGIVKYNDVAIDPQPTVTYSSSDETVATVDEGGIITFKKAGTTTITASYAGNDEYDECEDGYDLELFDTTPQETEVSITFNRTLIGLASNGNTTTNVDVSVKNVRIQMNKISGSNYPYGNTDEVRFYNKMDVVFTAPSGYVIKKLEFTKGSKWTSSTSSADSGTWTEGTAKWEGNSNSVTLTFTGTNSFESGTVTLAPVVTLNKYGYATYCPAHPIDFSKAEGFTAWRISDVSADGTITFSKITETIKEGQGVLLYNKDADGENKTTITLSVGESAGATEYTTSENKLVGITEPTAIEADTYYGLSGNKFVKVNAGTVKAGKALLPASEIPSTARELQFVFEDETTAIRGIENGQLRMENSFFDLQGRKIAKPKKGLYIKNGKKVVLK